MTDTRQHDPVTVDILNSLATSTVWDMTPVAFIPTRPTSCADATTATSVADLTGPQARARAAELDQFQRDHCATCPALIECAAHALVNEPYGTWGLTEVQRYGLGGVLPPDWPEINVSALEALDSITSNGISLSTVKDIVNTAAELRRQAPTRRKAPAA